MELDFSILKKTGFKQSGELDALFGVSRVMLNLWVRGKRKPGKARHGRVATTLKMLDKLVTSGRLPLKDWADDEHRRKAIEKIRAVVDSAYV